MMHKIYQEEEAPLSKRLKWILPRTIVGIVVVILFTLFVSSHNRLYNNTLMVIGGALFFSGLMFLQNWIKISTYYSKIEIDGEYIIFSGQKYKTNVSSKFKIKQVNVFLMPEVSRNGLDNIYIEFRAGRHKFRFNQLRNWDYKYLYALYVDFNEAKGEKIIIDEKYLLERLKTL